MKINYADLLVLIIFLIFLINGYYRGFFKTVYDLFSFIAAIILTKIFQPIIYAFIKTQKIYTIIFEKILNYLNLNNIFESLDQNIIDNLPFPTYLKSSILKNISSLSQTLEIEKTIATVVANFIITILSFLLVFLTILIILKILGFLINFTIKIPLIYKLNKIFGFLMGVVKAFLVVWIICIVCSVLSLNPNYAFLNENIHNSKIAIWFYENNYLLKLIFNIFFDIIKT